MDGFWILVLHHFLPSKLYAYWLIFSEISCCSKCCYGHRYFLSLLEGPVNLPGYLQHFSLNLLINGMCLLYPDFYILHYFSWLKLRYIDLKIHIYLQCRKKLCFLQYKILYLLNLFADMPNNILGLLLLIFYTFCINKSSQENQN